MEFNRSFFEPICVTNTPRKCRICASLPTKKQFAQKQTHLKKFAEGVN